MYRIKKYSVIFICFFLLFKKLPAQDKAAAIDSMMQYASANELFSGVIMVAEKGTVIYNKAFGYADVENKRPNDENTLFNLCSVTKQFTAMCIMILKEQGKLSYDDKLVKYFPGLPYPSVTLRQMLHHTSGLPDYFAILSTGVWTRQDNPSNNDIIDLLEKGNYPVKFTAGEKFEYNNTGYMLLASVIEKISGITFEAFLKKNIFDKAGMTNTMVYMPYSGNAKPVNIAKPYTFDYYKGKAVLTETYELYRTQVTRFDGTYGDGGIHSCSNDMIKWDAVLKTEKLVKKSTMEEAFTNGVLNDGKLMGHAGYGFGWFIADDPVNGKFIQHTGGWPGFRQAFIRYLDKDRTLLVLRNNEVAFSSIQRAVENILDGRKFTMPQTTMAYSLAVVAAKGTVIEVKKKFEEIKNSSTIKEEEINLAGYGVMAQGRTEQALEIMKINATLFPESWNAYDSLGELYLKNGDKLNAKLNYIRSLELNKGNDGARKVLESL